MPDFPRAGERAADVGILRAQFKRDQPVAMLAVGLKAVADLLRPLAKYPGALAAPDFYFVIDHWIPLKAARCSPRGFGLDNSPFAIVTTGRIGFGVCFRAKKPRFPWNQLLALALVRQVQRQEIRMKRTLAILATVATLGATAVTAPAEARGRGFIGPGLAFGLAAGALAAGAYGPYYGPGYGYYGYGPRYYRPAYYGPGPYAYYGGGPYYRQRYWRRGW
jgi:hypothetical protein